MKRKTALMFALIAVGLGLYSHTIAYEFVYDDMWTIVRNPSLDHVFPLERFFTDASTVALPESGIPGDTYRPLSTLSFAVQKNIFGLTPTAFRALNIALHLLNCMLLFLLLSRWLSLGPAFLGAALFLVHPVQVESVVWITQRSNLICGLGVLLSLLAWTHPHRNKKHIALALVGYGIALLGKETAWGLPILLWAVPNVKQKCRVEPLIIFLAGGLAYLLLRRSVLGHWTQDVQFLTTAATSLQDGMAALFLYGKSLLWPVALNVSYRAPEAIGLIVLGGVVILAGWIAAMALLWRRIPGMAWGLLTAFVSWLPHSGLVPLVTFAADRFLYLPLMGFSIALAFAGKIFSSRQTTRIICILLTFFALLAFRRSFDWKNEETLWAASVKTDPDNAFALGCYGYEMERQGRDAEAQRWYEQSLANKPTAGFGQTISQLLTSLKQRNIDGK